MTIRLSILSLAALFSVLAFAGTASAQTARYGVKYQQASTLVAAATTNINTIQAGIGAERAAFDTGMRNPSLLRRTQAKNRFLGYLSRLQAAYRAAESQYSGAIYWGSRYAWGLNSVRRTKFQGRQVSFQVTNLRNAKIALRNTRLGLERERRAAMNRW